MPQFLSPIGNSQLMDANGNPLVGGFLETYLAGTSTPRTTFTTQAGGTQQGAVMTLNSLGYPVNGAVWMVNGVALKFVVKNALGVVQSTFDNISGIGDVNTAPDEWVLFAAAPTYVSPTVFTVMGDQTNIFQVKRKLKSTNTGGTVYSAVVGAVFAASATTVTVSNSVGALDAGLSAVSYGLLAANNTSIPALFAAPGANNDITSLSGLTTPLSIAQGGTGTTTPASQILSQPNPTLAASALTLPASTLSLAFRSITASDGVVPATVTGTVAALTIPSTATLGTVSAVLSSIIEVVMNNAGTLERAVVNLSGGNDLTETGFISTTAISATATAANVFYSNTARTNLPYRVVRRIDSTQATAGAWVTSPSLVQGVGGQALTAMSSLGYGQNWQNFTGSRAGNTLYYNTTGKTITLLVYISAANTVGFQIGGDQVLVNGDINPGQILTLPVQAGKSYQLTVGVSVTIARWQELR